MMARHGRGYSNSEVHRRQRKADVGTTDHLDSHIFALTFCLLYFRAMSAPGKHCRSCVMYSPEHPQHRLSVKVEQHNDC